MWWTPFREIFKFRSMHWTKSKCIPLKWDQNYADLQCDCHGFEGVSLSLICLLSTFSLCINRFLSHSLSLFLCLFLLLTILFKWLNNYICLQTVLFFKWKQEQNLSFSFFSTIFLHIYDYILTASSITNKSYLLLKRSKRWR